jgi:hypothetical protein
MATADEYHEYARECLIAAAKAETEDRRQQFIDIARTWTEAALRLQGFSREIARGGSRTRPVNGPVTAQ